MSDYRVTDKLMVLLVGQGQPGMGSLRGQLEALGYRLVLCRRGVDAPRVVRSSPVDIVVVDVTSPEVEGVRTCRSIKALGSDTVPPVLLAILRADHASRTDGVGAGADGFLDKPIDSGDLRSQLELVYRNHQLARSLRQENERANRLNADLIATRTALDTELQLAHRLQGSLLPQELPQLPDVRLAAALQPSGAVSGDFYDVIRLDELHLGFYVADAIGHGVPAALLTIFIKKGVHTKDISGKSYRLLPPGEVLERLNDDVISAHLSDNPFVTMFYASLDLKTRTLDYSTGGHPAPLLLHSDGTSEFLSIDGPLLGVFRDRFPNESRQLAPGDRLIVYSDGIDNARGTDGTAGLEWMETLYRGCADLSLEDQVSRVFSNLFNPPTNEGLRDDTTMLALQVLP